MHGAEGGVMAEPEKDLGQQLRSDLQTAVDWQWLKVGSHLHFMLPSKGIPLTQKTAKYLQLEINLLRFLLIFTIFLVACSLLPTELPHSCRMPSRYTSGAVSALCL